MNQVRILQYRISAGSDDKDAEISHFNRYAGRIGTVIAQDNDSRHPITVEFDMKSNKTFRFHQSELETV